MERGIPGVCIGEKTDLRLIPSIVGGDQEKRHGIVLAKSTPQMLNVSQMNSTMFNKWL